MKCGISKLSLRGTQTKAITPSAAKVRYKERVGHFIYETIHFSCLTSLSSSCSGLLSVTNTDWLTELVAFRGWCVLYFTGGTKIQGVTKKMERNNLGWKYFDQQFKIKYDGHLVDLSVSLPHKMWDRNINFC